MRGPCLEQATFEERGWGKKKESLMKVRREKGRDVVREEDLEFFSEKRFGREKQGCGLEILKGCSRRRWSTAANSLTRRNTQAIKDKKQTEDNGKKGGRRI